MIRIARHATKLALLTTAALTSPAFAQDDQSSDIEGRADEIIVSGQRQQTLVETGVLAGRAVEDTPYSIVTFSDEYLRAIQARTLGDALRGDPSIAVTSSAARFNSNQTIRGFAVSGSGQFFDGLSVTALGATNFPINAIDRIEVIKGPNSALYGGSASPGPGGSINFVPRGPLDTADRFAHFDVAFTERDLIAGTVDMGQRFGANDAFGARINVGLERGTMTAQRAERDYSNIDAVFDWRPSDTLKLELGLHYIDTRTGLFQNTFTLDPGVSVPVVPNPRATITQPWSFFEQNMRFGTMSLDWKLSDDWSLEVGNLAGIALRPFLSVQPKITNATGNTSNIVRSVDSKFTYNSHQATLRGGFATGPLNHTIALTGNYNQQLVDTVDLRFPNFNSNIYTRTIVARPNVTTGTRGRSQEQEAASVGITDVVEIGPVTLIGGLRWNQIEQRTFNAVTGVNTLDLMQDAFAPTAAVQFAATSRLNIYANFSEGLEAGGTAPIAAVNADEVLPPIRSQQYEAGVKWQATDRLLVTAALFRINKGLEFIDAATNTFVQDGQQRHDGAELILSGELVPGLTVSGGYTWLNATARRTGNAMTEGNTAIGVPKHNVSLFGEFRLPVPFDLRVNGTLEYRSSQFVDLTNTRSIPDWTLVGLGARLNLDTGGAPLRLTARVDNVFDKAFWQSAFDGTPALAAPRTVTLAIGTSF